MGLVLRAWHLCCQSGTDLERFCCPGSSDTLSCCCLSYDSLIVLWRQASNLNLHRDFPYCSATRYRGSPSASGKQNHRYTAFYTSAPDLPTGRGEIGLSTMISVTEGGGWSFCKLSWPLHQKTLSQNESRRWVLVQLLAFPWMVWALDLEWYFFSVLDEPFLTTKLSRLGV